MVPLEGDRNRAVYFAHFGAQAVYLLDNSSDAGVILLDDELRRLADTDAELRKVAPISFEDATAGDGQAGLAQVRLSAGQAR